MQLIIACTRPGLIRGGIRHPKSAQHLLRDFTADQLREMLAEPELTLVIGKPLEFRDVEAFEVFQAANAAAKLQTHPPRYTGALGLAPAQGVADQGEGPLAGAEEDTSDASFTTSSDGVQPTDEGACPTPPHSPKPRAKKRG